MEKNMNARIQHKHDIEANWNKALNFIPKIGEIIVYDIDENYNYSRFKIGDGVRTISNLEFSETDLTGYATEKYVDEAITSLDAAFKILGKDPNGFGISVKAADNKTVIEALGEAGAGLLAIILQEQKVLVEELLVLILGTTKWNFIAGFYYLTTKVIYILDI